MIIQHTISALFAYRQLGIHNRSMAVSLQRLSSGYRINSAKDDPAGLGISERMRAQITALKRASLNAQDGLSMVNVAEGAMAEVHSMLNRLVDIATHAANGTLQDSDRGKLEAEAKQIVEEINRISQSTKYGTIQLLNGSAGSEPGAAGPPGTVVLQVGGSSADYDKIPVAFPNLTELNDLLKDFSVSSQQQAGDSLDAVKKAVEKVSEYRGNLGAMSNRLERTIHSLENSIENMTAAESRIRDADMAKEMMNFTRAHMLSQVAMMMMAHANQQPYKILELLRTM